MSYYDDGQPRPLIRPTRYPIRNQEDWPGPEETNLTAIEYCQLSSEERITYSGAISRAKQLMLIDDLADALEAALKLIAAGLHAKGQPRECCVAEPKPRSECKYNGQPCPNCPGVTHSRAVWTDPATGDLEAKPDECNYCYGSGVVGIGGVMICPLCKGDKATRDLEAMSPADLEMSRAAEGWEA